jgi:NhaP-type Na+/H+ or K+/H+ antiporter
MLVLSLAGLRGGTAFALALRWDNDATRIAPIETLTMGVILLTLCGAGECPAFRDLDSHWFHAARNTILVV